MAQLAARRSHNPKVASSILAGSMDFFIFRGPVPAPVTGLPAPTQQPWVDPAYHPVPRRGQFRSN